VDVFHHHLETVECSCFRNLNFSHESLSKVFENNAVTGSEKGQDILNEVLLVFTEFLPVLHVSLEVDLINGPEAGHLVLVHLPNIMVLDGQNHKTVWILIQ